MAPVLYIKCKSISLNASIPSLVDICAAKFITAACRQDGIEASLQALLSFDEFRNLENIWRNVEKVVQRKVAELCIPSELKDRLSYFNKHICKQILKWQKYPYPGRNESNWQLSNYPGFSGENFGLLLKKSLSFLEHVVWTMYGTINKKLSAEAMVSDPGIDITFRFHLACKYCIEGSIKKLWNKMIYHFKSVDCILNLYNYSRLLKFWCHAMGGSFCDGEHSSSDESSCDGIHSSEVSFYGVLNEAVEDGNKEALEFFLPEATPTEISSLLKKLCGYRIQRYCFAQYQIELFFLLFSQVDEVQQAELLEVYSDRLLCCLSIGPYQDSFMQALAHLWDVLSNDGANHVVKCLVQNIVWNMKVYIYDYGKLLKQFWQQCPIGKKKYIIECCSKDSALLYDLYSSGEKESLQLILVDANLNEQLDIISNYENDRFYRYYYSEWLEFLSYLKAIAQETQNKKHYIEERMKNADISDDVPPGKRQCLVGKH